ncbi:MAG: transcriptional regulator [Candidatus Hodarchaeales archaeon]
MERKPTSLEELIQKLASPIHEPVRLGILMLLHFQNALTFSSIQKGLGVTSGNLNTHLSRLKEEGLILSQKAFVNLRPRTIISITPAGRKALESYSSSLKEIIYAIAEKGSTVD